MDDMHLIQEAEHILQRLCSQIPTRAVGSLGNRQATDFFAETTAAWGFQIEKPTFDCMDWYAEGASLTVKGAPFAVQPSPYTLGGQFNAPLSVVSSLAELETAQQQERIVLLRGELAKEPLMPKNFPFYNPEEHQRIYQLVEAKAPCAILTATKRSPQMAGGVYPAPMFEDGDFDIPSAYLSEDESDRLAQTAGQSASLEIQARRIPSHGCNVTARKPGTTEQGLVFTAHIDAKAGTPGALDNGTGVTTLLLLAELLADYQGLLGIEITAINGEDYYSNAGEMRYLQDNQARFTHMLLNINLDGLGYRQGKTAYSLYECPTALEQSIRPVLAGYDDLIEGEPWYQGDHMIFLINQVPALAFTSQALQVVAYELSHTPQDHPGQVDCAHLAQAAQALRALIDRMNI